MPEDEDIDVFAGRVRAALLADVEKEAQQWERDRRHGLYVIDGGQGDDGLSLGRRRLKLKAQRQRAKFLGAVAASWAGRER